ncbi:MAG: glycoside hydrolase family 71/99-like protein [Rubripirellula sp.]
MPNRSVNGILRLIVVTLSLMVTNLAAEETDRSSVSAEDHPLILAHYMPWYQAKPFASSWGWHWTMNNYDPESTSATTGLPSLASHYHPLIGPYDSGEPAVLECQLLQMKLAGIDGVIVDWYGLTNFRDYASLHRNTSRLVEQVSRLGMKFVICYEDQTVPALVEAGKLDPMSRIEHVAKEIDWLQDHWFSLDAYVRVDDRPVLLSFGQSGLSDAEWTDCLKLVSKPDTSTSSSSKPVTYISQHHRRTAAAGAFDWPIPHEGLGGVSRFLKAAKEMPIAIPVVFPRFVDIYAEAKVHESWGRVEDSDGQIFRESLRQAIASKPRLIQIATWNDWGEGTVIEPSHEFGYRDLIHLQETRRVQMDPNFPANAADLKLPHELLQLRRENPTPEKAAFFDRTAIQIADGEMAEARTALRAMRDGDK